MTDPSADIVERLREYAREMRGYTTTICNEAADEIERLSRDYQELRDTYDRRLSDRRTYKVWVAMTPDGKLVDLGEELPFVLKRGNGWTDDTRCCRAIITLTLKGKEK